MLLSLDKPLSRVPFLAWGVLLSRSTTFAKRDDGLGVDRAVGRRRQLDDEAMLM